MLCYLDLERVFGRNHDTRLYMFHGLPHSSAQTNAAGAGTSVREVGGAVATSVSSTARFVASAIASHSPSGILYSSRWEQVLITSPVSEPRRPFAVRSWDDACQSLIGTGSEECRARARRAPGSSTIVSSFGRRIRNDSNSYHRTAGPSRSPES